MSLSCRFRALTASTGKETKPKDRLPRQPARNFGERLRLAAMLGGVVHSPCHCNAFILASRDAHAVDRTATDTQVIRASTEQSGRRHLVRAIRRQPASSKM